MILSSFISKVSHVFIEEEDNSSDNEQLLGNDIDGIEYFKVVIDYGETRNNNRKKSDVLQAY